MIAVGLLQLLVIRDAWSQLCPPRPVRSYSGAAGDSCVASQPAFFLLIGGMAFFPILLLIHR